MSDRIEPTNELTATAEGPEIYVRVAIEKQAKGYKHETTVSIRWANLWWTGSDLVHLGDNRSTFLVPIPPSEASKVRGVLEVHPSRVLRELLRMADDTARDEIAERERIDAEEVATP